MSKRSRHIFRQKRRHAFVKDARQEAKEHEHALLKIEEGVRLALEARRRAKEDDLGLKAEDTRLKAEAEEQVYLKA